MVSKDKIKQACYIAISNVLHEGTTDVDLFNRPFEIEYLKNENNKQNLCSDIIKAIETADFTKLKIHKIGHVLIPKKSLSDYRKCALIGVYDEIVYLTLVLILAREIEKIRLRKSSKRIFSYRYSYNRFTGRLFDPNYSYTSFRNEVIRKSGMKKNKVVVECDASNFYDRLNIHRIESVLRSVPSVDGDIINLINQLLLYWANRDSYGLPVGSNASRILAEVALIEVDNYLISKGIDFCRFVDDYRIFAPDAFTAHSHLALLVNCLNREGIFLNTQKTKIKDISSYIEDKKNLPTEVDNKDNANQDEANVADIKNREVARIIRGYSGLVPTKFRELSEPQKRRLCENNLEEMINKADQDLIVEPNEITSLVRTVVAQEKYREFSKLPSILRKFPQFIPYFVDVVLKKGEHIDAKTIEIIQSDFSAWIKDPDTPEYIQVYLVRLYASDMFSDKKLLLDTFRQLRRNSGDYIGRALLEALDGKLTRGELLEIRDYYYRADLWEERQIVKLIKEGLSEGEKRPFIKDIKIHNDDIFLHWMIDKKK